jgi:hypothetical protein
VDSAINQMRQASRTCKAKFNLGINFSPANITVVTIIVIKNVKKQSYRQNRP